MATMLTIGDFSRMTHLSVKALRHYHDMGVLEPAAVDPFTGYRSYDTSQVGSAQVIRRLRDLGMPLDSIAAVLAAPDLESRNREIAAHLTRMERPARADAGLRRGAAGTAHRSGRPARDRAARHPSGDRPRGPPGGGRGRSHRVGRRRVRRARAGADRHRADRRLPVRRSVPGRLLRARAERDNGLPPGHVRRRRSGRAPAWTRPGAFGDWRSPPSRRRSRSTRAHSARSTGPTARSARSWPSAPSA